MPHPCPCAFCRDWVGILTFRPKLFDLLGKDMRVRKEKVPATDTRASDYLFTWKTGERWPHENLRRFVDDFRSEGSAEVDWTCAAFRQIQPGDRAYLLKQGRPPRGIFGRGRVLGSPYEKQTVAPHTGRWLVDLRFDVEKGDVLCDPEVRLLVAEEQLLELAPKSQWQNQAAGISLEAEAARQLDDLINAIGSIALWNQRQELDESVMDLAEQINSARTSRQGFLVSPTVRKAIEEHAVEMAKAHYAGKGYVVQVHGKPYDLHCTGRGRQIFVEVKGTQTAGDEVLLTPNEVNFARDNKIEMALFIVHGITVDRQTEPPRASGGNKKIYEPWDVDSGKLEPLGYCLKIKKP